MGGSPVVDLQGRFGDLVELSLEALPKMFDEETGIFCQKTVAEGDRLSNRGSNVFYSAMSTAGILRQSSQPPESVFPLGKALDTLHGIAAAGTAPQVLANVVWALALAEDQRGAALTRELAEREDLLNCESAALGHVIHGLAVAAEAYPEQSGRAIEACRRWAPELLGRFSSPADLFGPFRRPTGGGRAPVPPHTAACWGAPGPPGGGPPPCPPAPRGARARRRPPRPPAAGRATAPRR